ncbi:zinc phosphodiesterase ELAC protein 2-like isoform X2 [Argiope bruennichi]|uniref:zinc phosphodiesterase ELAC protein 2-like isoform X2 n=1 Tax=Argiope bruennichi TaxID=94029 RepID=UPI002494D136|nr:zinc phosphodiesterase ELAC protein 2-like isoform X2 [Argiope bruennichi]
MITSRNISLYSKFKLLSKSNSKCNILKFVFCSSFFTSSIRSMPKDKATPKTFQEIKKKSKIHSKKCRFPPSEIYLSVLGNGSKSSSRALYMFTDHARYLFNCGEGTQRLAQEHKMKLSKLDDIFITHKSWENFGGLLGLSLTIQDMGVSEVTIHGPPNLNLLYEQAESFVGLKDLKIVVKGYNDRFCDDCMEVKKIPIFKTINSSYTLVHSSVSDSFSSSDSDDDQSQKHRSKRLRRSLHESVPDVSIAYVCKGHSRPGQLLLEKCADFNVPVGPLLGELKSGKDVVLPSGIVVHSKHVVSPEQVCPLFLVVECPSEEFIDPFVNEKQFEEYQADSPDSSKIASLVVHFTPPEILHTCKYQEWMQRFPVTTCHLILNGDCATVNSLAIHRIQHQLNLLHPGIFSLLHENEIVPKNVTAVQNTFQAQTLERYYLRPANGLDKTHVLNFQPNDFIEEAMNTEGFEMLLKDLHNKIQENAGISMSGTGSSIPSKLRNVSAILVKTSKNEIMVMDCGEGTYGQILRLYGKQAEDLLLQISVIFISHMHADHHLGLIMLLKQRKTALKRIQNEYKPILLIGPRNLKRWLKEYSRNFESLSLLYRFVECSSLQHDELFRSHEKNSFPECPDLSISTVPVNHCPDSHGIIVSSKNSNWKLVYSGDTAPCYKLVSAGNDCTLLIHEATMEDDLAEEAAAKRHCTTGQAIDIAKEMNAQYTILTHFSQRYAKVPLFNENFHSLIGCAFDNMKIRPCELYILPLLIPALNSLFAETVEELHTKINKRRMKSELIKSLLSETLSADIVQAKT